MTTGFGVTVAVASMSNTYTHAGILESDDPSPGPVRRYVPSDCRMGNGAPRNGCQLSHTAFGIARAVPAQRGSAPKLNLKNICQKVRLTTLAMFGPSTPLPAHSGCAS